MSEQITTLRIGTPYGRRGVWWLDMFRENDDLAYWRANGRPHHDAKRWAQLLRVDFATLLDAINSHDSRSDEGNVSFFQVDDNGKVGGTCGYESPIAARNRLLSTT